MAARRDRTERDSPDSRKKSRPPVEGPWPSPKDREEMSEANAARDNPGKHSKNQDWEKKW